MASTTVAHVAAGFDERAASLAEQGSHVWSTGPSVTGSATLTATIGVRAGVGIAKAGNLHVEAAFGPEFDATTGHGCDLHLDLGSLSAGAEIFGASVNTPSFTPFKIPLWSGCKPPPPPPPPPSGGTGGGTPGGPPPKKEEGGTESPGHASKLGVGEHQSCTIVSGGRVDCWGSNLYGQLGTGSHTGPQECPYTGSFLAPCSSTAVAVTGITTATKIASGGAHSCALLSSGEVDCWGENHEGELGTGSTTGPETCLYETLSFHQDYACSVTPVRVTGVKNATAITSGAGDSCALLASGGIDCWGVNPVGQLGNGTTGEGTEDPTPTPTSVSGITNAVEVVAGNAISCAVLATGSVDCWGWDEFGQLGDGGTESESDVPVRVQGITNATSVAVGEDTVCALLSSGGIECWGLNSYGVLGDGLPGTGETSESKTPVSVVGITDATAITGSYATMCAVLTTGTVDCWGLNRVGQLGNGTTGYGNSTDVPLPVSGITNATQIGATTNDTCALLTSGEVDCWGLASLGALGDGSTGPLLESEPGYSVDSPVTVQGLP